MASYTRYFVQEPQSPTARITASTPLTHSMNFSLFTDSISGTFGIVESYQSVLNEENFSFNLFSIEVSISLAALFELQKRPIFFPSMPSRRGEIPFKGTGSASAQGLKTSKILLLVVLSICLVLLILQHFF